ncbi:MAG: cytochrome c biogenesis protein CcsA [Deltaproteobacteria bacterium]|nr:cytochrome c biogenesis protein CcsA [Deltaproteobacteria bacterium]
MPGYDTILSRDSYILFFELRLFWLVTLLYGVSLIVHIFHIVSLNTSCGRTAHRVLSLAALLHIGLIILRTFEAGRAPFQTLYESLSWFACSVALTYLYASSDWKDINLPGFFVSALSLGASLYALLSRSPAIEPPSPPLQSYWFEWHAALAFFSYAVFAVSSAIEASCLIAAAMLRKSGDRTYGISPGLMEGLRQRAYRLAAFGFPLLTFAIFSGTAWADDAWGMYWSWDPKETWSLITWTVFTIYLHSRSIPALKGLPASVFNIIGFVCMMMTFLGVNWLAKLLGIPSLHIYAV